MPSNVIWLVLLLLLLVVVIALVMSGRRRRAGTPSEPDAAYRRPVGEASSGVVGSAGAAAAGAAGLGAAAAAEHASGMPSAPLPPPPAEVEELIDEVPGAWSAADPAAEAAVEHDLHAEYDGAPPVTAEPTETVEPSATVEPLASDVNDTWAEAGLAETVDGEPVATEVASGAEALVVDESAGDDVWVDEAAEETTADAGVDEAPETALAPEPELVIEEEAAETDVVDTEAADTEAAESEAADTEAAAVEAPAADADADADAEGHPVIEPIDLAEVDEAAVNGAGLEADAAAGDDESVEAVQAEVEDIWTPAEGPIRPSAADEAAAAALARISGEAPPLVPLVGAGAAAAGVAALASDEEASDEPSAEGAATHDPVAEPVAEHVVDAGAMAHVADAVDVEILKPETPESSAPFDDWATARDEAVGADHAEAVSDEEAIAEADTAEVVEESAAEVDEAPAAEAAVVEESAAEAEAAEPAGEAPAAEDEDPVAALLRRMAAKRDEIAAASVAAGVGAAGVAAHHPETEPEPEAAVETIETEDVTVDVESEPEAAVETVEADDIASDVDPEPEPAHESEPEAEVAQEEHARREVSELHEVVDGGYGWGSAAPVWDGAMPLGHPVKANRAWMQCQAPGDEWYDQISVDVWFTDVETAQRCGFRHGG